MIAVTHGAELVNQPAFAESDKHFNRNQTLLSASVATDRGGNERVLNVAKQSWYVKWGFQPCSNSKQMNDAWLLLGRSDQTLCMYQYCKL